MGISVPRFKFHSSSPGLLSDLMSKISIYILIGFLIVIKDAAISIHHFFERVKKAESSPVILNSFLEPNVAKL